MDFLEFCVEKMLFLVSFFDHAGLEASRLCVDLAHVYGYSSDCVSFRDCVVSHCVQLCSL